MWKQLCMLLVQGSASPASSPRTAASLLLLLSVAGLASPGEMWPLPAWKMPFLDSEQMTNTSCDCIKRVVVQTRATDLYIRLWLRSSWKCTFLPLYQRERCWMAAVIWSLRPLSAVNRASLLIITTTILKFNVWLWPGHLTWIKQKAVQPSWFGLSPAFIWKHKTHEEVKCLTVGKWCLSQQRLTCHCSTRRSNFSPII